MAEIRAGLHFTFRQDPLRSLMLVTVLMSASFGVMMINLPEFAKETLGKGPLASSALFGAFAPGMLIASLFLAFQAKARGQGMKLALAMGLGLGTGQLLLGMSASYPVAFPYAKTYSLKESQLVAASGSIPLSASGFIGEFEWERRPGGAMLDR